MYRTMRRLPSARLASRFARLRNFTTCLAFAGLAASALTLAAASAGPSAAFDKKTVDEKTAPAGADGREALKPSDSYGRLPLAFEPNRGQADPRAEFVARGEGYQLSLAAGEATFALRGASEPLRMKAVGADTSARGVGLESLAGVSNYFKGADPSRWLTRVPHFARVRYAGVYEGVDLVYYGNGRRLEYDFRVAAGADPARVALAFDGARRLKVDAGGDLLISSRGGGDVRLLKPFAYQEDESGARTQVAARYRVEGGRVRFRLGAYDRSRALVIDPCVEYATFLGGSLDDRVLGVAVDAQGHAYVAGLTTSPDFHVVPTPPTPLPSPTPTPPDLQLSRNGLSDAFVSKLSEDGSTLLWSTYFGGSGAEDARGLAVDAQGNAYITGITDSSDLPTFHAFQPSKGSANAFTDAYVAKIRADGAALEYSTYLGGWRPDTGQAVAVDASGAAYVTGNTGSYDTGNSTLRTFPVTAGAYRTDFPFLTEGGGNSAAFVTKLSPAGALAYSTFLGGLGRASGSTNGDAEPDDTGFGIAVNASGEAYVTGRTESERFPSTAGAAQGSYNGGLADAFVTRLDASGSSLLYSTFLGGAAEEDRSAGAVALDPAGNVYVTGTTSSTNFPTLNPVTAAYSGSVESDAYTTKLSNAGAFVYSTYLGTNNFRRGFGIAADDEGNAYVVGSNALRKLNAAGALVIPSRTLGGEGRGVALDAEGNVYVGGITTTTAATKCTSATQFCPTAGALQQNPGGSTNDGFVLKFEGEEDEVEIAGFTFPRAALADDAFQTKVGIDASAQFCSRVDYAGTTIAQRVKSALTDGCPATSTLGDAEFEADFVDNRVVNLPGADLAVFEIGSGNGNEPFSVSVFNPAQNAFTSAITYTPQPTVYFDCANLRINVALIDLDDFGVAPGAQVTRFRFDNLFVPNVVSSGADIADIAAIHSAPPNSAPTADAGLDQTIEATGQTTPVMLDGSASTDPDGDALSYEWRDAGNNVVGNGALVSLQLPLGTHTFTLDVSDGKGGTASDTVTVVVRDTTAPDINCGTADGQWHASDVQMICTASDAASGLANASDASFTLSTNVANNTEDANASTNSRQVCDNAGNCSTAGPVAGNKVDRKAPDINLVSPAQGASYTVGQSAAAAYNCSDGGSGVVACVGSAASGGAIDTSSAGAKSFTVTAADAVGNVSTKTVTYFVGYGVCALYDQTKAHKSGSTVPVKLNLCGAGGENLSAAGLTVTALGTVRLSDFAPGEVEDAGQANPDDNFRFTTLDGSGGYVFNLQTKGLTTGTYVLVFKAGSDPSTHGVQFQIK
ncbi:MAG TPA: SBBP repeat-containing protein [Pyrinomonadaceae bacterium]|nr:SBBP repeat-containing protein [Pyrinomonadaceae bacterium]